MLIRHAEKEDIQQLVALCKEHSVYEKAEYSLENKAYLLTQALFDNAPPLNCLVIANQNLLYGYATFMQQFSTWDAEYYLYLDCLFLKEEVRGHGYGSKLLSVIIDEAKKRKIKMLQWQTPTFNRLAIDFYSKQGAHSKTKERFFYNVC